MPQRIETRITQSAECWEWDVDGGEVVRFSPGTARWSHVDGFTITVEMAMGANHRPVVHRVQVERDGPASAAVSTGVLQRLRLGRFLGLAQSTFVGSARRRKVDRASAADLRTWVGSRGGSPLPEERLRSIGRPGKAPRCPHQWTDERLRLVASAVQAAQAAGRPTQKEVMAKVPGVNSLPNARTVIRKARQRIDPQSGQPFLVC